MTPLASVLLDHMRDTCRDLGIQAVWVEFEHCNWLDRYEGFTSTSAHEDVLDSFEYMSKNDPVEGPSTYWMHEPANVKTACDVLDLFGYAFESDWLAKRSAYCIESIRKSARELAAYEMPVMKIIEQNSLRNIGNEALSLEYKKDPKP